MRVARPTKAPTSSHLASASSTVREPSVLAYALQVTTPSLEEPKLSQDPEGAQSATSQCLRGILRQSPHLGTTRPSDPTPPPIKENLWVSYPRVPLPREISTSVARRQDPVPPRHEPVPPSREYPTAPREN